jgi:hypothetical protein
VPSGCAVSGWSAPARQANSFTALYFNPPEIMDELSEHYASVELYPALYFEDPSLRGPLEKLRSLMLSQPLAAGRLYGETPPHQYLLRRRVERPALDDLQGEVVV